MFVSRARASVSRWIALAALLVCSGAFAAPEKTVALPGHVLPALAAAQRLQEKSGADPQALRLTVILRRDDEAGFASYLAEVYDPASAQFRRFLPPAAVSDRYGPSADGYAAVRGWFAAHGFRIAADSANRMTLDVEAPRATVAASLGIGIDDYVLDGRRFHANDGEPNLPPAIAARVHAVQGLSDLARPQSQREIHILVFSTVCMLTALADWDFLVAQQGSAAAQAAYLRALAKCINQNGTAAGYGKLIGVDPPPPAWQGVDGTGQRIGLLEYDHYTSSDVADYIRLIGLPDAQIDKVQSVAVGGGTVPGANQDEVLLDLADVLSVASGAQIGVYHTPFSGGASFQAMFNAMIDDQVDVISNSWAYCEDQTSAADVQSIDAILQAAAASGISVFSGSGDTGSTCLDGAAATAAVPASAPHLTAVGGTSLTLGPGYTYASETWWDGSGAVPPTGQGGFGSSRFFPRPAYQDGLHAGAMRSLPDVAANADPARGVLICAAALGGCPTGGLYGGTSSSTPLWAAFTALLNQAQGENFGWLNPALYPLAGTDAFHTAASMGSDFAHVGLGSPNLARLHQRLTAQTPGAVDAAVSEAHAYREDGFTYPADLGLPLPVPADGSTPAWIVVRAADANGNLIGGATVTLSAPGSHASVTPASATTAAGTGSAVFTLTDASVEDLVFTVRVAGTALAQTPRLSFVTPRAAGASILAFPTSVAADGIATTSITVTLHDAQDRPTPGKRVELAHDGRAVVTAPAPAVTDADGRIVFTATDAFEESVTFTAVDVSDGNLPVPGSAIVSFSGSAAGSCVTPPVALGDEVIAPYLNGFAAYPFFYGNTNFGCVGATNPAFDAAGNAYVGHLPTGDFYRFAAEGGSAGTRLSNLGPTLGTPVFDTHGRLYATHAVTTGDFRTGDIVEIDPNTGAQLRVLASNLTCPHSIAFDPLSGDLFFDDNCTGAGSDDPSLFRLTDPSGADPDRPTEVTVYATLPGTPNGVLSFAPDGTLYVATVYNPCEQSPVMRVSATDGPSPPTVEAVPGVTSCYWLRVGATDANGAAQSLLTYNLDATGFFLNRVEIATPAVQTPLARNLGSGTIGNDGCLYSSAPDVVYKLTPASGVCDFAATNPSPALALTPRTTTPNPRQGDTRTLTATFSNLVVPPDTPVSVRVTGANPRAALVRSDANGVAQFAYQGVSAGADVIVASATVGGLTLTSNPARLNWDSGPHASFLAFVGATGAHAGTTALVQASLTDIAQTPQAAVAGASVHFEVNGVSCEATTAANGVAGCPLPAPPPGVYTLTASYAGDSAHLAATASTLFAVPADDVDRIFADGFD
ncbi:Ig-like domain-containing protein [Dokdonella ginsengisoli]|uniref:Ig-like domain-containing protein n=1 Tax=Dokdonella ginsengisoli TaxID=363846 RepID=A0ABV9QWA1_9GAMM